jgi:hypothetical protein
MIKEPLTAVDFDELVSKGTTVLADGRRLQFSDEHDDDTTIDDDSDLYGRVRYVERDRFSTFPATRPDGFNGAAVKMRDYSGACYWWQPPTGVTAEVLATVRSEVEQIMDFGFSRLRVEVCEGTDAYGAPIVVGYACCSGVEPLASHDVLVDIARDIAYEALDDADARKTS